MAFDLRAEIRDSRSGRTTTEQHYTVHLGPWGMVFERDGKYYLEDGALAGDDIIKSLPGQKATKKPETATK